MPFRLIYILILIASNFELIASDFFINSELGISANYGFAFHNANFRKYPNVPSCCPNYTGGTGYSFAFGALFRKDIDTNILADFRLNYEKFSGKLEQTQIINLIIDGESQDGLNEYHFNSNLNLISLEPSLGYRLTKNFSIYAGLDLGYLITGNFDNYEKLIKPENRGTFNNKRRIRNDISGKLSNLNKIQAGIKFGLSYRLPLDKNSNWFLIPELNYTLYFTNVAKEIYWKVNTLNIGVAITTKIKEKVKPKRQLPAPPPFPEFPQFPVPEKQAIDITAIKLDSNGNELNLLSLKLEDIVTLNMRPLLNYIFFGKVSSEIPERYVRLSSEQANEFNLKSIHDLDPMQTYYQVLNIVGKKLKDNPDYNIKLVGTNSGIGREKNNLELSQLRAESVKSYFTDVWKVPPGQIEVEARNLPEEYSTPRQFDAWEENRRVEILPSNKSVLEPILTLDTIPNPEKVKFRFYPIATNITDIKSWKIDLLADKYLIESIDGNGTLPNSVEWTPTEKDFLYTDNVNDITYRLTIIDNRENVIQSVIKKIPLEKVTIEKKKQQGLTGKNIEYYRLILFDFGKTNLLEEHSNIIQYIKNRISSVAKVSIIGYTDKIGDWETNKQIAKKRAQEVGKLLDLKDAEIIGSGEENLLYDNTLPEGRFYCRTVNITVEMPVK
ncbi:MAG: OmpA family protein [Ignavibacteriae bacterium]|nr:OmpA family protein [Ignavibacteriota bacterium]